MRALISVSDKTGVVEFARGLRELGWQVIATGGTMKLLAESGVEVINISDVTGFPEICDGRVKTLHPKVHGGLLARRDDPNHLKALRENGIEFIDMVCVNLYPFRQTIAREGVTMDEAIENIDIGGPSMLRSAAKNYKDVTVVCDPADYDTILAEIRGYGNTTPRLRLQLSAKAYTHTAEYDAMIATYMREKAGLDEKLFLEFDLVQPLRYGENPHQQAKFYRSGERVPYSLAYARQLNGKEMSYNNIQDANAALSIVREFDEPFCVGLKHMNPCGAAVGRDAADAWTKAYEADKVSIFGGIVALNRPVTREAAELMKPIFLCDGRIAGAGPRPRNTSRDGGYVRDGEAADGKAARRSRFRLAYCQACEVERYRSGEGRSYAGCRSGADESHRLGGTRAQAGPCPGCDRRAGTGFGRLFPLRRLREPGGCERRRGDRAAGRQRPGRGFDPEGQ